MCKHGLWTILLLLFLACVWRPSLVVAHNSETLLDNEYLDLWDVGMEDDDGPPLALILSLESRYDCDDDDDDCLLAPACDTECSTDDDDPDEPEECNPATTTTTSRLWPTTTTTQSSTTTSTTTELPPRTTSPSGGTTGGTTTPYNPSTTTTTTTTTTGSNPPPGDGGGDHVGAIVGGTVGGIVGVAGVGAAGAGAGYALWRLLQRQGAAPMPASALDGADMSTMHENALFHPRTEGFTNGLFTDASGGVVAPSDAV